MDSHPPAFTCSLPPAALRARREELQRELSAAVLDVERVPGGYRLWLEATPERLAQAAELIAFEKDCCSFLDFALELRAGAERSSLTISGPAGAAAVIAAIFLAPLEPPERAGPPSTPR
jgi:hypothetical protein